MLRGLARYLGSLRGNARICVLCHPFWSLPFALYYYYLGLYLKESGVSEEQIGVLVVVGTVASLLFSLVAAPLVDRMGRRRSILVFDLLSSAAPPLLYALSGSYWMALIATILYNTNKVMSVGYYLVMIEDADNRQRLVAFNLFNIITYAAGLFIPLAGVWVARFGVTKVERVFLLASFLMMSCMIVLRHRFLRETQTGQELMKQARERGMRRSLASFLKPYQNSLRLMSSRPDVLFIILANVFFFAYMTLGTNQSLYFALFFNNRFHLGDEQLSMVGGLYSAGMLFAMVCVNPLIRLPWLLASLKASLLLTLLGMLLLLLLPVQAGLWLVVPVLFLSLSFGTLKTGLDSALAIHTEGQSRSGVYALTNLLSALVGIGSAALVSGGFSKNPGVLFVVCLFLGLMIGAFVFLAQRSIRGRARGGDGAGSSQRL